MLTHKNRGQSVRALLAAIAVSGATFMSTAATAQAGWAAPNDNITAYCSGYTEIGGVKAQDCIVVTRHANGAWVQTILAVSNTSNASRRVRGETHTYLTGVQKLSFTNCGDTTIGAGGRRWCWGATTNVIGHGRPVSGTGVMYDYTSGWQLFMYTPLPDWVT